MLFIIAYQLCKEFPALSPYDIDEKRFRDVIKLYSDVRTMQIRESKIQKEIEKANDPNRIIRRPAGDDWF